MLLLLVCLFFFFKQKTAYEMRISDWSSDVCSSDLTSASCCTITSRLIRSAKWAASAPRRGARPATASSPGARYARCCRRRRSFPTRSASFQTSPGARKSVVEGKSVAVRVDLGGRRSINKQKYKVRVEYTSVV